ncbi:MAG TPA: cupin-like domain-containing protein, partial [Acidisarcina sp.]
MMTIHPTLDVSERASAPPVARIAELTVETFISDYVTTNQPVVVTGAMLEWEALKSWEPQLLAKRFGKERVQVYGDLFRLANITPLSDYLDRYFGQDSPPDPSVSVPYVRWYCHLAADERVPWADDVFARFAGDWARPAFFPAHSFALPFCPPDDAVDPTRDWFPARGLFISAKGARTRLHADPWASDALLCQIYGDKDFVMYDPSQAAYLSKDGKAIDIEKPDFEMFPD